MYVFSIPFWLVVVVLAAVHAKAGPRLQRWILLVTSIGVYASFGPALLLPLAGVVVATWIGIRGRHYTDDRAMLRFVRIASACLAFLPLIVMRLADDAVTIAGTAAVRLSLADEGWTVALLLPVGVAFYTLQAVDAVFASRSEGPRPRFLDHVLFVSFFPTVFMGPVQRHQDLMPQLTRRRTIGRADLDAAALAILFGSFWKLVVADNVLPIADGVFATPINTTGPGVIVGTAAFAMGIVADVAGYSAMVVGVARLFGVQLMGDNVDRPYLARSPLDFWNRWLVPVTTWIYRHIYLGMARDATRASFKVVALAVTFLAGAWWYGGRSSMFVWAGLHFVALLCQLGLRRRRAPSTTPTMVAVKTFFTFGFIGYTWLWFRAPSLADGLRLHLRLLSPEIDSFAIGSAVVVLLFSIVLVLSDYIFIELRRHDARVVPVPTSGLWSASLSRGAVFAGMMIGIVVLSTADLHQSVLGLR